MMRNIKKILTFSLAGTTLVSSIAPTYSVLADNSLDNPVDLVNPNLAPTNAPVNIDIKNGVINLNDIFKDNKIGTIDNKVLSSNGLIPQKEMDLTLKMSDDTSGFDEVYFGAEILTNSDQKQQDIYEFIENNKNPITKGNKSGEVKVHIKDNGKYFVAVKDQAGNMKVTNLKIELLDKLAPVESIYVLDNKDQRTFTISKPYDDKTLPLAISGINKSTITITDLEDTPIKVIKQQVGTNRPIQSVRLNDVDLYGLNDRYLVGKKVKLKVELEDKAGNKSNFEQTIENQGKGKPVIQGANLLSIVEKHKDIAEQQLNNVVSKHNQRELSQEEAVILLKSAISSVGDFKSDVRLLHDAFINSEYDANNTIDNDIFNKIKIVLNIIPNIENIFKDIPYVNSSKYQDKELILTGDIGNTYNDLYITLNKSLGNVNNLMTSIKEITKEVARISLIPATKDTRQKLEKELDKLQEILLQIGITEDVLGTKYRFISDKDQELYDKLNEVNITGDTYDKLEVYKDVAIMYHRIKSDNKMNQLTDDINNLKYNFNEEMNKMVNERDNSKVVDIIMNAQNIVEEGEGLDILNMTDGENRLQYLRDTLQYMKDNSDGAFADIQDILDNIEKLEKDHREKEKGAEYNDINEVKNKINNIPYENPKSKLNNLLNALINKAKVIAKLKDLEGNLLKNTDKEYSYQHGVRLNEEFEITAGNYPTLIGYLPKNAPIKVNMNSTKVSVDLTYEAQESNITVEHIDIDTGNIIETENITTRVNQPTSISAKSFKDYVTVSASKINYTPKSVIEKVEFKYRKEKSITDENKEIEGTIKISFIDKDTQEDLTIPIITKALVGTSVTIQPKVFKNYEILPDQNNGITIQKGMNYLTLKYEKVEGSNPDGETPNATDPGSEESRKEYKYTIKHQNESGETISNDIVSKAVKGLIMEVNARKISGYIPIAPSITVNITDNENENVFIQKYKKDPNSISKPDENKPNPDIPNIPGVEIDKDDKGNVTVTLPDGTIVQPGKSITLPDGTIVYPDGTIKLPNGTIIHPDGSITAPDGTKYPPGKYPPGTIINPDGSITLPDKTIILPDGTVIRPNGTEIIPTENGPVVVLPDTSIILPDGTIILPDNTIIMPDGTVYPPGTPPPGGNINPDGSITLPDGTIVHPDGSVTLPNGTVLRPNKDKFNYRVYFQTRSGKILRNVVKTANKKTTVTLQAPDTIDGHELDDEKIKAVEIISNNQAIKFQYKDEKGTTDGSGGNTDSDGNIINGDINSDGDIFGDGNINSGGNIDINAGEDSDGMIYAGGNGIVSGLTPDLNTTQDKEEKDGTKGPNKSLVYTKPNAIRVRPNNEDPDFDYGELNPYLDKVNHNAYITGYGDGTAKPTNNIVREEAVTIIYKVLDADFRKKVNTTENNFSDVDTSRWSNEFISTLAKIGIVKGKSLTQFYPTDKLTRAEAAALLVRFQNEAVDISNVNISDIKGHWAENDIKKAYALNWIKGYPDGTFGPNNLITRAELVTIVNKMLDRGISLSNIPKEGIKSFSDLKEKDWFYTDFIEASNGHEYNRENEEEIWTKLLD